MVGLKHPFHLTRASVWGASTEVLSGVFLFSVLW